MSGIEITIRIVAGLVLLGLNALFVTTEFALTRLRQFDKEDLGDRRTLNLAWDMTGQLEIYLTSCQVGITLTSILLGVVFEPGVTELIHPLTALIGLSAARTSVLSVVLSVVGIQLMHTVWGEQTPTYLGVEKPIEVAALFSPVVYAWTWVAYPVIFVGDYLAKGTLHLMGITLTRSWTETSGEEIESRAELRQHLGRLLSEGELSDERRKEVLNALDIEARSTRSIMIDRSDIRAIRVDRSVEENLDLVEEHRYSRYPLIDGNLDEFLGIIYLPALLPQVDALQEGTASWEDIAAAPMSVPADLPISELVDRFQDERQEMAVVEDEDGTVVGLVTSTDALEAIIGELRDPFDEGA